MIQAATFQNSLLGRLVLLQVILVVSIGSVFAGLFYFERNQTLARLFVERWAFALRASTSHPEVLRSEARPADATSVNIKGPRLSALQEALTEQGISVLGLALGRIEPETEFRVLWLQLPPESASGKELWIGVPLPERMLSPTLKFLAAILLAAVLLIAGSYFFVRRLTLPLLALKQAMETFDPTQSFEKLPEVRPIKPYDELASIQLAWAKLISRIQQVEHERSMMLAGISHDLRSPLARIRLAAETLADTPDNNSRSELIVRNVRIADKLIGDFLSYVRAGESELDEPCHISRIAADTVARAEGAGNTIHLDAEQNLWVDKGSPSLVESALQNLLDNACRHGRPPVLVRVVSEANDVVLEVLDHGTGIAPAMRATATQAFVRGDSSRHHPGTGLGLAIVERVVKRMRGRLSFIDQPLDGRFGIRLHFPQRMPGPPCSKKDQPDADR